LEFSIRSPKGWRLRAKLLVAFGALTLITGVFVYFFVPPYVEGRIRDSIQWRAERMGFNPTIGPVDFSLSGDVRIAGLRLDSQGSDGFAMALGNLEVESGNMSLLWRHATLDRITLERVQVNLPSVDAARKWLNRGAPSGPANTVVEAAPRSLNFAGFDIHLVPAPYVDLKGMDVTMPGAQLSGCRGFVKDVGMTTNTAHLKSNILCDFATEDRQGKVEVLAERDPDKAEWDMVVKIEPPVVLRMGERSVKVGGLHRKADGSIEVVQVGFGAAGLDGDAGRLLLGFKEGVDPISFVRGMLKGEIELKDGIESLNTLTLEDVELRGRGDGDLSGRIRSKLEGWLPKVFKEFPSTLPDAEDSLEEEARRASKDPAIKTFIIDAFISLEEKLQSFLKQQVSLERSLPVQCVVVRRARIIDNPTVQNAQDVLHHVDGEVCRKDGTLQIDISFRTPTTGREKNRIALRIDPTTPAVMGEVSIQKVPLVPYRTFLPSWVTSGDRGALRDVSVLLTANGETQSARLEGKLTLKDVALVAPAISEMPVHFQNLGLGATFDFDAVAGRLDVRQGLFDLGPKPVHWSMSIQDVPANPQFKFEGNLGLVSAQRMFEAIPEAMVSTIQGARFKGKVGASLILSFQSNELSHLRLRFEPIEKRFKIVSLGKQVDVEMLKHPLVHRLESPTGRVEVFVDPKNPYFIPYSRLPKALVGAITTTEDGSFFEHEGFARFAIRRSLIRNLEKGSFVRGASTVSQQTVKNLFLSHEKTIARKIQESIITHQMERTLTKERILELYFNIIEWGPDIYGLGHATEHYFGRSVEELGLADVLFLVSLIPSPRTYYSEFERGRISRKWRRRLDFFGRTMVKRGKLSKAAYDEAKPMDPVFKSRDIIDTLPPAKILSPN
jgi:hypothetical protein